MLSRRKLFSMVLIMVVLFVLFMFTKAYISSTAEYEINPYTEEIVFSRSDSWEADGAGETARQTAFVGSTKSNVGDTVAQWCTYAKRPLSCFDSISEYLAAEDGAKVLCIEPDSLSLPSDEDHLAELARQDITIIFCALPEADTVMSSPALCALLGIEEMVQEQAPLTGACLYGGFLLGGEALYGQDTGMDVDLEIPWYSLESGTRVYMTGLAQAAQDGGEQKDPPAILWRNNAGRARVFAVNGNLMEDETGFGILDGMLAEGSTYLLYPVVNAQNLTVADYPSFATENSEEIQRIYANNHGLLLKSTIWQSLLATSVRSGFKMTYFMTTQLRSAEDAPQTSAMEYYLRHIAEGNGEMGRSADGSGAERSEEQWERDSDFIRQTGTGYTFSAAYAGEDTAGFVSIADSGAAPDIRTAVSDDVGPLMYFLTEDITCQGITHHADQYGFREDLKNRSLQTALAYTNILLDLRCVTWPETEEDYWENYSRKVLGNIETWWKPYSGFNKTTATESDSSLREFLALDYKDRQEGDTITLELSGRADSVSFLLRTHDREVWSVSGGTATKLEKDIWLLSIDEDTARIEMRRALP